MFKGSLSPRINNFITNPFYTRVDKSIEPQLKNYDAAKDGTLHIEYDFLSTGILAKKIIYKIKIINLTKEDSDILKEFDGFLCDFYPHSDFNLKYSSVANIQWYHKNNRYYHDGCTIEFIVMSSE